MKLIAIQALLCLSFVSVSLADTVKQVPIFSGTVKGAPIWIYQSQILDELKQVIFLSVEPACGGLPVKISSVGEDSYTFEIVYTDGGISNIDRTKEMIGITSNRFSISFKTETAQVFGQSFTRSRILAIEDSN